MKIGCVVLAAGNARRFGSNKLNATVEGESLIRRALEAVPVGLAAVVVSQYPDILALAGEYGFAAVRNNRPDLGLSLSVRLGLEQLLDWPFWLAHYTTGWVPTSFRYHYHMWQYSSSGTVPGIPVKVDLNLCLTDWSDWGKN